jgi:hypothetical protein
MNLSEKYIKSELINKINLILIVNFFLICQYLSKSPHEFVEKFSLFLVSGMFLVALRKHINLKCLQDIKTYLRKSALIYILIVIFFLAQMVRPLFWSLNSRSITILYWPLQLIILSILSILLIHGQIHHKHLSSFWSESKSNLINNLKILNFAYFLFLVIVFILMIFEVSLKFYSIEIGTNYFEYNLEFFILAPLFWAMIAKKAWKEYFLNYLIIFLLLAIALDTNSRLLFAGIILSIFFGMLFVFRSNSLNSSIWKISPFIAFGIAVTTFKISLVKQILIDTLSFGSERTLDYSGIVEVRDLDRVLHLKAAFTSISENMFSFFFGYGYKEYSFALAKPLSELYSKNLPHLNFINEVGSYDNVSSFGLSSFLTDFGIIGLLLLVGTVAFQIKNLPWSIDLDWCFFRVISILLILSQLLFVNFLDSPLFFIYIALGFLTDKIYLAVFFNRS